MTDVLIPFPLPIDRKTAMPPIDWADAMAELEAEFEAEFDDLAIDGDAVRRHLDRSSADLLKFCGSSDPFGILDAVRRHLDSRAEPEPAPWRHWRLIWLAGAVLGWPVAIFVAWSIGAAVAWIARMVQ